MIINLGQVVGVMIFLIIAGGVFGLLHFLVGYCESKFPTTAPFANIAAVLILIGLLLNLAGYPVVRFN